MTSTEAKLLAEEWRQKARSTYRKMKKMEPLGADDLDTCTGALAFFIDHFEGFEETH